MLITTLMASRNARPTGGLEQVIEDVTEALKAEGFGKLSDINVAKTFKAKLDIDRRPDRILGACNPTLANQAIGADADVGLLLPCSVVVREEDDNSITVAFMDPVAVLDLVDNPKVKTLAKEVRARLQRARAKLA